MVSHPHNWAAHLRRGNIYTDPTAVFGVGTSMVFRFITGAIEVLAALAPTLRQAIETALPTAFVILGAAPRTLRAAAFTQPLTMSTGETGDLLPHGHSQLHDEHLPRRLHQDVTGGIAFSEPDEEVHRFANQQTRETAVLLFGRGLYEVMEEFWTAPERADGGEVEAEFARDLSVGGAGLAASLLDLIDEFRPRVVPAFTGGRRPYFPLGADLRLRLVEQRAFRNGTLYLRYERVG